MIFETSKNLTELKRVANKNHETFWDPPNLKSLGGKVANFQSSGIDLFFLECMILINLQIIFEVTS